MASNRPVFGVYVDWLNDGDFSAPGDDVTTRVLTRSSVTVSFGRDQARALSPVKPGAGVFELSNVSRDYSPENTGSPLYGNLVPGRPVLITAAQDATTYTFYRGFLDDYTVQPNPADKSLQVSCLDVLARFGQVTLSTQLLGPGVRTGTALGALLDQLGWPPAARDLDTGASTIRWWWEEGTDGLTALNKILGAEGPPSIAYVDAATGNFVFRDRHHRLVRPASLTAQATFTSGNSAADGATVATYSPPASYDAGWRDIVNTVSVAIAQRDQADLAVVWTSADTIAIANGATVTVIAQAADPFTGAVVPAAGTDFVLQSGTVTVALSRTSGQSATISITDTAGGSVISGLQLQACPVTVSRTVQVAASDAVSAAAYGVRGLPSSADMSLACAEDAAAVAAIYLARYAQRRPIITVPVINLNGYRLTQQLSRDLSDRVHVTDTQTGLDADCFIEQISHAADSAGMLMATMFGCEKAPVSSAGSFTFDTSGLGFNQGTFGVSGLDDPAEVFIFDDATQGQFDVGLFGT